MLRVSFRSLRFALLWALCTGSTTTYKFDRNHVGVAFGPYTKQWEPNDTIPEWSSYTLKQLQCQLTLISSKFTYIATYNFGSKDSITSQIPNVVASINKAAKQKMLSIAQGIHQLPDPTAQMTEITSAFEGAQSANAIFSGSVWALTVNWEDNYNPEEGIKVWNMIKTIKTHPSFQSSNLKIGARTQNCETAFDPDNQPQLVAILGELVKESDYLMCNLYPDYTSSMESVESAVNWVSNTYSRLNDMVKGVNSKCELIIGETGWPSEGVAFNGSPTSVQNMAKFWELIGKQAATHEVKVFMFEGIDEPWKSDRRNRNPQDANGYNGGEGHYGWWVQTNNSNPCSFLEKTTGLTVNIV